MRTTTDEPHVMLATRLKKDLTHCPPFSRRRRPPRARLRCSAGSCYIAREPLLLGAHHPCRCLDQPLARGLLASPANGRPQGRLGPRAARTICRTAPGGQRAQRCGPALRLLSNVFMRAPRGVSRVSVLRLLAEDCASLGPAPQWPGSEAWALLAHLFARAGRAGGRHGHQGLAAAPLARTGERWRGPSTHLRRGEPQRGGAAPPLEVPYRLCRRRVGGAGADLFAPRGSPARWGFASGSPSRWPLPTASG
jgi:hypothetical protein